MFKQVKLLFLYTEAPLHVGSGNSLGTVDLPIQRERHTNLPMIQASGIKGKLRNAFESNGFSSEVNQAIFGPREGRASEHAGALSPGDGRILLFPVRSLSGVFAWITCPLVISRFIRDLSLTTTTKTWTSPDDPGNQALVPTNCRLLINSELVLEEFTFSATPNLQVQALAQWLAENALPSGNEYQYWKDKLKTDLVVLGNDAFKDFCQFSTDVVSRTLLVQETKTAKDGGLWTEENLPSDTLLYTPLFASDPRIGKDRDVPVEAENASAILNTVQTHFTNGHSRLQLGGNETVGRGIVATRII